MGMKKWGQVFCFGFCGEEEKKKRKCLGSSSNLASGQPHNSRHAPLGEEDLNIFFA